MIDPRDEQDQDAPVTDAEADSFLAGDSVATIDPDSGEVEVEDDAEAGEAEPE